jgi:hypothetical protein
MRFGKDTEPFASQVVASDEAIALCASDLFYKRVIWFLRAGFATIPLPTHRLLHNMPEKTNHIDRHPWFYLFYDLQDTAPPAN